MIDSTTAPQPLRTTSTAWMDHSRLHGFIRRSFHLTNVSKIVRDRTSVYFLVPGKQQQNNDIPPPFEYSSAAESSNDCVRPAVSMAGKSRESACPASRPEFTSLVGTRWNAGVLLGDETAGSSCIGIGLCRTCCEDCCAVIAGGTLFLGTSWADVCCARGAGFVCVLRSFSPPAFLLRPPLGELTDCVFLRARPLRTSVMRSRFSPVSATTTARGAGSGVRSDWANVLVELAGVDETGVDMVDNACLTVACNSSNDGRSQRLSPASLK